LIRQSRQSDLPDGWQLLQWINKDKRLDNFIIAEDLQDNEWIKKKVEEGVVLSRE
jgi:hypothetical protein